MTSLEDRLRRALDDDMTVHAPDLLDAAHRGVRRRRRRNAAGAVCAVAVVTAAVVAAVALPRQDALEPDPTEPTSPTDTAVPEPLLPDASAYVNSLRATSEALFASFSACADPGPGGACTEARAGDEVLWRYRDSAWERLGESSINSSGIQLAPNGLDGITTGTRRDRYWRTSDGGATWQVRPLPARCYFGADCALWVTPTGLVLADWDDDWYAAPLGTDDWEQVVRPDAGRADGYDIPFVVGDTLVAQFRPQGSGGETHYWLSSDSGRTWDGPHDFPGASSTLAGVGSASFFAECQQADGSSCGTWRTTDLVTWQQVRDGFVPIVGTDILRRGNQMITPAGELVTCGYPPRVLPEAEGVVGDEVFVVFHRNYAPDGSPIEPTVTGEHTTTHQLMVSRDYCASWQPALE